MKKINLFLLICLLFSVSLIYLTQTRDIQYKALHFLLLAVIALCIGTLIEIIVEDTERMSIVVTVISAICVLLHCIGLLQQSNYSFALILLAFTTVGSKINKIF